MTIIDVAVHKWQMLDDRRRKVILGLLLISIIAIGVLIYVLSSGKGDSPINPTPPPSTTTTSTTTPASTTTTSTTPSTTTSSTTPSTTTSTTSTTTRAPGAIGTSTELDGII